VRQRLQEHPVSNPASYPFTVSNQYGQTLVVYSTMSQPVTSPPSTDASDYYPVYTSLGTVAAGAVGQLATQYPLARIVIARASDEFPLKLAIVDALDPDTQSIAVAAADGQVADSAWAFYQSYASQPYQPLALQFNDLVTSAGDPSQINANAAKFFSANGYPGVDFGIFAMMSYWAANSLYAFPGSYWCYAPQGDTQGFILPTVPTATIVIANGSASYTPADGSGALALSYSNNALTSAGADSKTGIALTGIVRDLTWEGQPDKIVQCFVGTDNGTQTIAQPYQNPTLPWYAVTYDLVYGVFYTVQLAMAVDMAISVLTAIPGGLVFLKDNLVKLAQSVRDWANKIGEDAAPDSALGEEADPINVDTDVDVDVDVDIDVDIDVDTDVDVDVDIDIDVDVDFLAVVDVDVDIDIDIDVDVVTDSDTDVDIDVDTDIDTDVDVQPGMLRGLLNKLGNWIMTKALPALLEMAVINVAFYSAGKLLEAWKDKDAQGIQNLQPRESTGLGLLINYMLNENHPIADRWNTFADFVEQSQADATTLAVSVSAIVITGNAAADQAAKQWPWSKGDEDAAVAAMATQVGSDMYRAFQTLGAYTYKGMALPVKVGAGVALRYLKQQP
jgi:hypothetical protein